LIQHHGEKKRWLMVSSAPYMSSIALWCRMSGLRLARGSSGQGGAAALEILENVLKSGESVMLAVDGPAGPGFKVKRGCIDLAQRTGLPIIPVAYTCTRGREVKRRWDRMLMPRLFNSIQIKYGAPIFISQEQTIDQASLVVEQALNSLET
jgi:lysophospholipid acyltransferase (LPLAT)-like uncharacterized protein